jgi:tetratricopeptide (TPR) repeat protein
MMDIGRVEYLERANSSLGKSVDWFPYEIGTYTHWGIASLNLAQMHNFSASEMAKSIDIFKLGNAIDPYNADNLHLLGKIYLMNGMGLKGSNSELAKQAFITSIAFSNKAIKVDPYYAEVYFNRGMAEEFLGQENLALADYEITFMINPSLNMAMDSMQKLYTKQGRPQDFLKVLDRFVKRYPENPIALGWVGDWFMNKNLPASALAYYEKAYKYDNNNRVVYYNLINAKIENGQGKEVLPQILEEVQKDFGSDMAHFTLAHYYFRAGDKVQAREQLEETLRLNPNNTSAQNLLKTIK